MRNIIFILFSLILLPWHMFGSEFEKAFTVVFIDSQSEAKYGSFPIDRSLIAEALERLAEVRARGVVLKFFYDRAKDESGDVKLAKAMSLLPVVLQARLDDTETNPSPLPKRFVLTRLQAETAVSGKSGWIPLERFSQHAKSVGFVDFTHSPIPMLEKYQDEPVKSLVVCSMELALGKEAVFEPEKRLSIGARSLRLDAKNQIHTHLPNKDELNYVPFQALLERSAPINQLTGKVIILGYDGPSIQKFDSPMGKIGAHRLFVHELKYVYEQMMKD